MKAKISKLIIIIGLLGAVVLIGIFVLKNFGNQDIRITELEILDLKQANSTSKAIKMVQDNTVKIINEIDKEKVSYGTGFFIETGYLVTNSHVVDIEGSILVEYPDGTRTKGYVVSNDILSDVALLKVDDVRVKAIPFKSTIDLDVTNDVYAIGYPYNFSGEASVTSGIVSAKRSASGIEFIQTDASINSGSSGGPLINEHGELLGMVTLSDETSSFSMAISSDSLLMIISSLDTNKKITFIDEVRPINAMSVVLKEVNYLKEDIYNERLLLDNDVVEEKEVIDSVQIDDIIKDNETDSKTQTPSNKGEGGSKVGSSVDKVDKQNIDKSNDKIVGTPKDDVINTIDNNDESELPPEEPKVKLVTFEEVKGVWFYPGYADVCQIFSYEVDSYHWYSMTMDHPSGRLQYNAGGSLVFLDFEEIHGQGTFVVNGNNLTVNGLYTLTRTPGSEYYNENNVIPGFNWCMDKGF